MLGHHIWMTESDFFLRLKHLKRKVIKCNSECSLSKTTPKIAMISKEQLMKENRVPNVLRLVNSWNRVTSVLSGKAND